MNSQNNTHTGGACCHHPEPVTVTLHPTSQPLLHIRNLGFQRDGREILSDINLQVNKGDFVAITGPNGGGKTTLLHLILGLHKPTSGSIDFASPRPTIGYLPQKSSIDSQFPITVAEVISSGLTDYDKLTAAERRSRIDDTLRRVEMTELADRAIGRLSGGQLQRALLGRAIISKPDVLVLDEPLSYIDKHFEAHIYRLLAEIAPHCTILLVSHEMTTISTMANRHWLVDHTVQECHAHHHEAPICCD